jgi:hypothetical protein
MSSAVSIAKGCDAGSLLAGQRLFNGERASHNKTPKTNLCATSGGRRAPTLVGYSVSQVDVNDPSHAFTGGRTPEARRVRRNTAGVTPVHR